MKQLFLVAVGALSLLGTVAAFAQGLPAGTVPPQYGSMAFPGNRHLLPNQDTRTPDFWQAETGRAPPSRTVEQRAKPSFSKHDG